MDTKRQIILEKSIKQIQNLTHNNGKKKKILIVGGTGFIGYHLAKGV